MLRPELAVVLGAERFLNEIKVTANLQHPHILALYDSGEADSFLFYVMPFIEGESWQDKIDREHQLPVEEAVRLAGEVASALDYAHRHDVVHRDIKPANIMLADGGAQVADFGIALAVKAAGGDRLTETGLSLGTPHYMSPEQATGDRDIDSRSDIYSLGAVLYESLAGEPPHTGGTLQAVISKLITEDAKPVTAHRGAVPVHVALTVERALARIPADRFATAADFRDALKDPQLSASYAGESRVNSQAVESGVGLGWRQGMAGAVLLLIGLMVGRVTDSSEPKASVVGRFGVPVTWGGDDAAVVGLSGAPVNTVALSPDGETIVFVGRQSGANQELFMRRIGELEPHAIPGTQGGAFPTFSPDGTQLAFLGSGNGVFYLPMAGGVPVLISHARAIAGVPVVWIDDRNLAITLPEGGLAIVEISGGISNIAEPNEEANEALFAAQTYVPEANTLLAIATSGFGTANGPVVGIDLEAGDRRVVLPTATNAVRYSDGVLLWARPDGVLQGALFDAKNLVVTGPAVTLAEDVRLSIGGEAQVAVSTNGSMVYVPEQRFDLMLVDRSGRREVAAENQRFHSPRFSPNGRSLAFDFTQQGTRDVWTLDIRQKVLQRLTFANDGHDPVWSPDGRTVAFISNNGVYRSRADGGGVADSVYVGATATGVISFAPDGWAVTSGLGNSGSWDLRVLNFGGSDREEEPILSTSYNEQAGGVSPDGRWLAYSSDETGRDEVYVRGFGGSGSKTIVSQDGGSEPIWSRNTNELFYIGVELGTSYMVSARFDAEGEFRVVDRTRLFETADFEPSSPHANYDVSPDGNQFAFVHLGTINQVVYVMNWTEEVRRNSVTR